MPRKPGEITIFAPGLRTQIRPDINTHPSIGAIGCPHRACALLFILWSKTNFTTLAIDVIVPPLLPLLPEASFRIEREMKSPVANS